MTWADTDSGKICHMSDWAGIILLYTKYYLAVWTQEQTGKEQTLPAVYQTTDTVCSSISVACHMFSLKRKMQEGKINVKEEHELHSNSEAGLQQTIISLSLNLLNILIN